MAQARGDLQHEGWSHASWGMGASSLLHILLVALLLTVATMRTLPPSPVEDAVSVKMVPPPPEPPAMAQSPASRNERPPAPAPPPPTLSAPTPAPEVAALPPVTMPPVHAPAEPLEAPAKPTALIPATTLYSARVLADPRSRQARAMMKQLDRSERMVQLCNLEGMQQVSRHDKAFRPDFLVAYALEDVRMQGERIIADGAAFRSKGNWFALRYECGLKPDGETVADFAFSVGEPVPREEWAERNLVASDGGAD